MSTASTLYVWRYEVKWAEPITFIGLPVFESWHIPAHDALVDFVKLRLHLLGVCVCEHACLHVWMFLHIFKKGSFPVKLNSLQSLGLYFSQVSLSGIASRVSMLICSGWPLLIISKNDLVIQDLQSVSLCPHEVYHNTLWVCNQLLKTSNELFLFKLCHKLGYCSKKTNHNNILSLNSHIFIKSLKEVFWSCPFVTQLAHTSSGNIHKTPNICNRSELWVLQDESRAELIKGTCIKT